MRRAHVRPRTTEYGSLVALVCVAGAAGCTAPGTTPHEVGFAITVTHVNGLNPPTSAIPLPANVGTTTDVWDFTAEALDARGALDESFTGYARVTVEPGAVVNVTGSDGLHRNIFFENGVASGSAGVTAVFGPARLWVEDLGYTPAPAGVTPFCSDGVDNDGDGAFDFPTDPGCAFPNDDSEEAGSGRAGVSTPVHYALPTAADLQGRGSETPYPAMAITLKVDGPNYVVVTRVASTGFFATDLSETTGYGHIYAFNFSAPFNMRVCDRLSLLSGTASEFFGETELSFPSFEIIPIFKKEDCLVPEPTPIDTAEIADDRTMEMLESGLVRISGFSVAKNFGPKPAINNVFAPDQSNCDLNGDGVVDFTNAAEGSCGNICSKDAECAEWNGYVAQGNFKARKGATMIQLNVDSAAGFDPLIHKGGVLTSATGTLRNFSGGSLNWTVEARCLDDIVCATSDCAPAAKPANEACINLRPELDNDDGTN